MKNITASLLHTAWTEEEKLQLDKIIDFVERFNGKNFLTEACLYLYQILGIDYIHIGLAQEVNSKPQINTIVQLYRGQIIANKCYRLHKSPLSQIFQEEFMYLPFGLCTMYPDYEVIKQKNFESYIGKPILNAEDEPLGIIVLLHSCIIERGGFVEALLNALVPRIETELATMKIKSHYSLEASY